MKAITILQPWASLIACGAKKIETRGWATKYRGPIAIHAGKKDPCKKPWEGMGEFENAVDSVLNKNNLEWRLLPLGSVIAIADLVDVYEMLYKHIPLRHPMEFYDQPEISYEAMVYADEEKTLPVRKEIFHVPAQRFTRPAGGEFKETWLCQNEEEEFKDIGGDELVFGHFATGRYAWLLENVRPITPVPARGQQGLWNWEGRT
nr:ASCH domain-containing protein [uncultured Anaeromusa sp.]